LVVISPANLEAQLDAAFFIPVVAQMNRPEDLEAKAAPRCACRHTISQPPAAAGGLKIRPQFLRSCQNRLRQRAV